MFSPCCFLRWLERLVAALVAALGAASLAAQQTLVVDPSLASDVLDPSAVRIVDTLPLADGDVIVAGEFLYVNGEAIERLVRLNADGSIDGAFGPVEINGSVFAMAAGPGGTTYICGTFTRVDGEPRNGLARLSSDGALDATFLPSATLGNLVVRELLPTTDGGVLVAQAIPDGAGQATLRIDRLTRTGAVAPGFTPVEIPGAYLQDVARGPDDSLIVLSTVNGTNTFADQIRRFGGDGVVDSAFHPSVQSVFLPRTALVLGDGSVILGGSQGEGWGPGLVRLAANGAQDTTFSGVAPTAFYGVEEVIALNDGSLVVVTNGFSDDPPPRFMRFSSSGVFDSSFANQGEPSPLQASMRVRALADGGFLALGDFEAIGGQPISFLARYAADGSLRASASTRFSERGAIERLVPFGAGTMLVGGSFASIGEHVRGNLVRLGADDSLDAAFPETDGPVADIVVGTDGRVVVLGAFSAVPGSTTAGIFRVDTQNGVDSSLLAGVSTDGTGFGAGTSLADGSLVVAGASPYFVPSSLGILKILPDGTRDAAFGLNTADTSKGPLCVVSDVATDASDRLLLIGADSSGSMLIQGVSLPGLACADASGRLDALFAPTVGVLRNSSDITPLPDGGFMVLGQRSDRGPGGYPSLLRFLANGTIDDSFNLAISAAEYPVGYLLTPDQALLVSTFDRASGTGDVRRFSMAGTVDASFAVSTGATGVVTTMAFDALGRLWLAGSFTEIDGHRRIGLARLAPSGLFVAIEGPSQVVVVAGASHTLTSVSSGASSAATLQWHRNGLPIEGARGASLSIGAFGAAQVGDYTLTLTDGGVSRTSHAVRLTLPIPPSIITQPATQDGSLGGALVLRVQASGLPAPTFQWFRNGAAIADATSMELRLTNLTPADAGAYTVRVSNPGGTILSSAAVISVTPIGVDLSFEAPAIQTPDYVSVRPRAGSADNSILLGINPGQAINGVPQGTNRVVRLRLDGTVDSSFVSDASVHWAPRWVQPDGTGYLVIEERSPRDNFARYYLRRILPDGTRDVGFGSEFEHSDYGPASLAVFPDGRIMIGGTFLTVDGVARAGIARLLANGTVDTGFHASGVSSVMALAANPDGTTLAVVGEGADRVVRRFLASGDVDPTLSPAVLGGGADHYVGYRLHRRSDGSVLVAGTFQTVNGVSRRHLALLGADGALAPEFGGLPESMTAVFDVGFAADGSVRLFGRTQDFESSYGHFRFSPTGDFASQREIVLGLTPSSTSTEIECVFLPDGSLFLSGRLMEVDGQPVRGMAKLDPNGDRVASFRGTLGIYSYVWSAEPLDNGRWMIAGWFDAIGTVPAPGLAIVEPDGRVDPDFRADLPDGTHVTSAVVLGGGRILLLAYIPPVDRFNPQQQRILLGPEGTRDRTHDAFLGGSAVFHAVGRDGAMYFSERNPLENGAYSVTLRRYRADFSVDTAFAPVRLTSVDDLRLLSDGRVFVICRQGDVIDALGTTRSGLCRLTSAGLVDATFTAPTLDTHYDMLPKEAPGGKFVIAGAFAYVNGVRRVAVARLNADGSLDPTFVPPSSGLHASPSISDYIVDEYGRVFLCGFYRSLPPINTNNYGLTRLNADGSLDTGLDDTLTTLSYSQFNFLTLRSNGDVLVTGRFSMLGEATAFSAARITANRFQANAVMERVAIPEGGSGFLEVRLTGAVTLPRFAWTRNGEPLADGDRSVLALRNFSAGDVGIYRAEVTSADGSLVRTEPIEVSLSHATIVTAQTPLTFSVTGGLGGVRVDTPAGTSWTASGLPDWIETVAAPVTSGSRTLSFLVKPNDTGGIRSATISIAGEDFPITQGTSAGRIVNISTRGRVGFGEDVMIVGVITTGSGPLDFLGRGVGPTLSRWGLVSTLPDPAIDLKAGQTTIAANDNWDGGSARAEILAEGRRVGAFDLTDGAGDAALLARLMPGSYTAVVFDKTQAQGVVLAEFYDRTVSGAMAPHTRLVNISTRGRVGVGEDVMIAGFVVSGNAPKQVLVRGIGPELARFGVSDCLRDPVIRVVRDGKTVAHNNDWASSGRADLVGAAFRASGAFALDLDGLDSALVVTLDPGTYTVILSGADGSHGVAMVEVYDLE